MTNTGFSCINFFIVSSQNDWFCWLSTGSGGYPTSGTAARLGTRPSSPAATQCQQTSPRPVSRLVTRDRMGRWRGNSLVRNTHNNNAGRGCTIKRLFPLNKSVLY